jgi:hypothetical protein
MRIKENTQHQKKDVDQNDFRWNSSFYLPHLSGFLPKTNPLK